MQTRSGARRQREQEAEGAADMEANGGRTPPLSVTQARVSEREQIKARQPEAQVFLASLEIFEHIFCASCRYSRLRCALSFF